MAKITNVEAHQILDSRNKPTLEVKVTTDDGLMASDSVPSGTSTGSFEAKVADPQIAVNNVNNIIKNEIIGMDPTDQRAIDMKMIDIDGTEDKSRLGANAILGVSLAVARVAAMTQKMPLYWYLNKMYSQILGKDVEPAVPMPMMVMIEGGKHGDNNICIQEFSVLTELEKGKNIWLKLKDILEKNGLETKQGLEGGFTPRLNYDEDGIKYILEAVELCGYKIGDDVKFGLDVAGNHCQLDHDNVLTMMERWPIYSLEDPVGEDDWDHWAQLKLELDAQGRDYLLIGDDIFVTNKKRLEKGITQLVANSIIIKVNQTGCLWETLEVIALANKANYSHIVSHRSGETMDTFISDLACATNSKYIKSGAPFASERVIKYNRLEEIRKEL